MVATIVKNWQQEETDIASVLDFNPLAYQ